MKQAMKQPVIEAMALSGKVVRRRKMLYSSNLRVF